MILFMKSLNPRSALKLCVSAGLIACSVFAASPAWAMQIFVDTANDGPITLDVEPSDTTEGIKAKLDEKIQVAPANQCLLFNGVFLEDGQTLDSYGISKEDRLDLIELPITAAWSITPDDPALGREVSNSIDSHPEATQYEVVAGALPVGVTLNESTGAVTGHFDAIGAFTATIGVTTICGETELDWSGTVPGSASVPSTLPATGEDSSLAIGPIALALATGVVGATLIVVRRRSSRTH